MKKHYLLQTTHSRDIFFTNDKVSTYKTIEQDQLKQELSSKKSEIDNMPQKVWEIYKKIDNDYEYIYTSSKQYKNICSILPVSRSYFKLHEIIKDLTLLTDDIVCGCIAEGPGGFIHCLNDLSSKCKIHKVYGITLISKDTRIPYWNISILKNKMNDISNGKDETGDIYNIENAKHFIQRIGDQKCHLVTADGGFDYSNNYNTQEDSSYKLLYSEIFIAMNIQKIGGHFILKVFDLFSPLTIQLLYLLYTCYSQIYIYKPSTSRLSNSEKYIVCSNFLGISDEKQKILEEYFNKCGEIKMNVPDSFIDEIYLFNQTFVSNQINTIDKILTTNVECKQDVKPTEYQKKIAIEWCQRYELPINQKCIYI